jgi:hypothetical protein
MNGVVALEAAVQWARQRADKVVVRLAGWDQEFSAGAVPLDGLPPLPEGMELRPRRSAGWEFLDRTPQDEEIDWDVDVGVDTFALVAGADLGLTPAWPRIRSALVEDSRILAVAPADLELPISNWNGAWTAGVHTQVATVRVRARTAGEAGTAACAVMAELATATGWGARRGGTPEFTQAGAYPTGSRAAQANAGFRPGRSSE